ncbi:MAG: RagB/SusD family nutrient uptake outer membrane protein [Bacteroidetes bacterium]|nr:RagB/SusD family nutrient uptake outer membrane protein [Bacteroidota bacterium]
MNTYFRKTGIFIALLIAGIFVSCTDYLDKAPYTDIDADVPFKDFTNFQGFTEELYNCIPIVTASDYHNTWNWGEDEYYNPSETRFFSYWLDQGNYWGWNTAGYSWLRAGYNSSTTSYTSSTDPKTKGHLWGLAWYGIRKANVGLANLDKFTGTDTEKNLLAGQLYFFRGWFHFMLMQYWGGLPYVGSALPSNETPKLPRLGYQQTADSVARDFQKAADLLPVFWDSIPSDQLTSTTADNIKSGKNDLRINKIMALAYLGKDLLWAGSPLMNRESTGVAAYNTDYCKKAADAFGQALQLCDNTKFYELIPFSNYSDIFYIHNSTSPLPGAAIVDGHKYREAMFMENVCGLSGRFRYNQVNDYRPPIIKSTGIKMYPTANYVDYFGMNNGLPILDITQPDAESGYNPQYPWKNRDPRFYKDIIYDGVRCVSGTGAGTDSLKIFASLFGSETENATTTGKYRQVNNPGGNGQNACFTGYMNMKFTSQYLNNWDGYIDNNSVVLSFMRLADVYLMYAESVAAGYGSPTAHATGYSLTAVYAVNKVRDRVAPDGSMRLASKFTTSTDVFMPELCRERAVELAFEGHRFTDLRRWLMLLQAPYTLKKTVYFDRDPNVPAKNVYADPSNAHVLNLREGILSERHLGEKHYWFPFLQSDVNLYTGFTQNLGW